MLPMIWIWVGAIVLFGVIEAVTTGLVSIWFVVGSVAALIAAALDAPVWLQVVLFVVVSGVAVAVTRPLLKKFHGRNIPTNADRVINQEAKVTEEIDNENGVGAVFIDGKTWTARSADNSIIPIGTMVLVQRIEGVKLVVKLSTEKVEVAK